MSLMIEGILPINKPAGVTSFRVIAWLRHLSKVQKIGHAGTLDPFATGVLLVMIGKKYTRLSNQFMATTKEYETTLHLGVETDTHDIEGKIVQTNDIEPCLQDIQQVLTLFQGAQQQIPPMHSAKKIGGQKLYDLARKGIEIERLPCPVNIQIKLLTYTYPLLRLHVTCTPGTYIRSLARDIGKKLGCGAHLEQLQRTRSGSFKLENCLEGKLLQDKIITLEELSTYLLTEESNIH